MSTQRNNQKHRQTQVPNERHKAALEYATVRGWDVFPAPLGTKKSYLSKKTKWGSGLNWGKTKDPELINLYWRKFPEANDAIPTGPDNGFFVVEVDTTKGHKNLVADGEYVLQKLAAEHGALPDTLMAESPSGSIHRFYNWPEGLVDEEIRNSVGKIGIGIDVRGAGGMVLVPPSIKPGVGTYRWLNDLPIADAPQWLIDAAIAASSRIKLASNKTSGSQHFTTVDFNSPDALQALDDACVELAETKGSGTTNDTLNFLHGLDRQRQRPHAAGER
jgi:Bifunctional DNA primase/polymerase, N-terminal